MIQSLAVGSLLALIYSYCLHRWSKSPVSANSHWLHGGIFRVVVLGVIFIVLAKFTAVDIARVLFAFIAVITLYLMKQVGGAILASIKAGAEQPQRRS
ncbi:MAG: hypothetical protein ACE5FZ_03765 [Nitrospiria bacterium]